jgi:hypothetical protein
MKTHFGTALVILAVLVAVSVNGTPPVANSATPTTETVAGTFGPFPVIGPMNPGPAWGHLPPGSGVGLLSANGFLGPLTPGAAFVNRIPAGQVSSGSTGTIDGSASSARAGGALSNGVMVADPAQAQLFGPPSYDWQNLPFKTEIPPTARPLQSKVAPTESRRVVEERNFAVIRRLVQEDGLSQAQQKEKQYEELMSRTEIFQPDVSYCSDQINILKTFLR